jgi:L-amino acid N-acyltransferase YncA
VRIISCDISYAAEVLDIFNDAIVNTTALYEYKPRTMETVRAWFESKVKGNYPVVGAVTADGELMGFGSYGPFRNFPAYKYTVEHSIYVASKFRWQGIGMGLLEAVIVRAREQNYHVLVGAIDSENSASIALHRKCGFQHAGTVRQVGFKFGRWLDLDLYQLILTTPVQPQDG